MTVRVGVVGLGAFGQHHLRLYQEMPGVEIAAVVDIDITVAEKFGKRFGLPYAADLSGREGDLTAVSIATPAETHFALARSALSRGIHCLVEKPLAQNLEEAEELLEIARIKGLVLQVGHIERFNPAVREAQRHVKNPRFITANRLGPYDERAARIGVVLDIMIHDLDIVPALVGKPVQEVDAIGSSLLSSHEDIVNVRLKFEGGCVADLNASRISLERSRHIRIFQPDAYISLDCADQRIKIYKKKREPVKSLRDIEILTPRLKKEEPLRLELEHFVECVREGKKPLTSGEHGRDALELAHEILKKIHAT